MSTDAMADVRDILDAHRKGRLMVSCEQAYRVARALVELHAAARRNGADFVKQAYGPTVATILETDESIVEVQERNDGVYGLIVHARHTDRDQWDDLTAYLKSEHFEMLGSIAKRMRGEIEPRLCEFCKTWNSKPCGNGCAWQPTGRTVNQVGACQ